MVDRIVALTADFYRRCYSFAPNMEVPGRCVPPQSLIGDDPGRKFARLNLTSEPGGNARYKLGTWGALFGWLGKLGEGLEYLHSFAAK